MERHAWREAPCSGTPDRVRRGHRDAVGIVRTRRDAAFPKPPAGSPEVDDAHWPPAALATDDPRKRYRIVEDCMSFRTFDRLVTSP